MGSTSSERAAAYPCDELLPDAELVPGLERLEVGQRMMTIFRLASFERDRHLTLECRRHGLFGDVAVTYVVAPAGAASRLVVKLLASPPRSGLPGLAYRAGMPWGDLVMMRKQLLTLKSLAEGTAAA